MRGSNFDWGLRSENGFITAVAPQACDESHSAATHLVGLVEEAACR